MRKLVTAMVLGTALVGFAIGCQDNSTKPPVSKPKSDYTTTTAKPKADEPTTSTTSNPDYPTTTTAAPTAKPL